MLQILKEFNAQQTELKEISDEINEMYNTIRRLEKRAGKILNDAHTETDVLCEVLDSAGFEDYKIQPREYNQTNKPYTITRIVKVEGFSTLVELDRATGALLIDGKAVEHLNAVLV